MKDEKYAKLVWNKADKTKMYKDILNDLIQDKENPYRWETIRAKDENDYARVIIWTNFLWKYIVQLVNDMISYVWQKEWWEETEDLIRKDIGLEELMRYKKSK